MKSTRSTLFRQKSTAPQMDHIPLLSKEDQSALVSGENLMLRTSYIFDNSRANRHIDAQTTLKMLYQIGAELINKGTAYSTIANISSPAPARKSTKRDSVKSEGQQKISDLLMKKYHSLPAHRVSNGSHSAENPFHALFVIRVALDHMAPESVYLLYTSLKIHLHNMTIFPNVIAFPNGSEFLGDYAVLQILRGYITQNMHLYDGILTKLEKAAVMDKSDMVIASYSCLTNDKDRMIDDLLGGSILGSENQYSLRKTWG